MLIRVHYSVNNQHVARSVLEEASLKMGNKSVLRTWCVIIQHIWWKQSKSMISVMALLGRNCMRQTTVSRGNAVVEILISSATFFRLFSPHIFPQTSSNICKKCWFSLFLWNRLMTHNSVHIETNISKHFKRNKLLCLLQAGRSHVIICNDLWEEVWMSDISSECPGMHWCNSNCFCPSISTQGRHFDAVYHKLNLVSKLNSTNQKVP